MKDKTLNRWIWFLAGVLIVMVMTSIDSAHATGRSKTPPQQQEQDQQQDQAQDQAQQQEQAQQQDQAQQQGQEQTQANEQTNSQSVTFTSHKTAMSAIAPNVFSSNPCYTAASAAIGLPKINIGGGKQEVDPNCEKLEAARMLGALGEVELAIQVVCATTAAQEVLGDTCAPSTTMKARLNQLEADKAFLLQERAIDRQECDAAKDRILAGCNK